MRNKLIALLLAVAMAALTGCQLAREPSEQENASSALAEARFVGVYVVREDPYAMPDRTHWVEYGSSNVETQFGSIPMSQEILIGQYDEETHDITFPGMDGYALFAMNVNSEERGSYHTMVSDMMGGSFHVKSTDAGDSYELSGTLYYGAPVDDPDYDSWEDDRVWHHYKVYQMEDGTVFLNGYGDSHNGDMGTTQTVTYTTTVNGEEMEVYTKVGVNVEFAQRLESLTVFQYDADGNLLTSNILPIEGELPVIAWEDEAEWAVVEEVRGGEATRTAYDRPGEDGEEVVHTLILLDEEGMGYGAILRIG